MKTQYTVKKQKADRKAMQVTPQIKKMFLHQRVITIVEKSLPGVD